MASLQIMLVKSFYFLCFKKMLKKTTYSAAWRCDPCRLYSWTNAIMDASNNQPGQYLWFGSFELERVVECRRHLSRMDRSDVWFNELERARHSHANAQHSRVNGQQRPVVSRLSWCVVQIPAPRSIENKPFGFHDYQRNNNRIIGIEARYCLNSW